MSITVDLDNPNSITSVDTHQVLSSVLALPQQCEDAFKATSVFKLPEKYHQINKVLMTGMGGSGLGARIIETVYQDKLEIPLIRLNDYHLPQWVDRQTLVICSSYSGTTEETLSNAHEAIKLGCPWIAIAAGSTLIELAKSHKTPYYQIETKHNPSNLPRMAIGYSLIGQLNLVAKTGLFELPSSQIQALTQTMKTVIDQNKPDIKTQSNAAKMLAIDLYGKQIIFLTARHLLGAAHVVKNQSNENAKTFSALFDLPELNHHLMEGLLFPATNPDTMTFLLFTSSRYESRLKRRFELTQDVINQNGLNTFLWEAQGNDELSEAFSVIQFGALVVFYLSILNQLDPSPIPWVDYFKTKLGQSLGIHN